MKIYDKTHLLRVRLDPVFMTGIDMVSDVKAKASGDFTSTTMSDVVREALALLFQKYDISKAEIEAAINSKSQ